jgi:hypothetical protein
MSTLIEFEEQVRAADGQITTSSLYDCLAGSILSEGALKHLEVKPNKKFLGPIHDGTMAEIYGPRGIGKTWLREAIAYCLTRKLDLGPFKSDEPAGVLIVDGEMSLTLLKDRQALSENIPAAIKPLDIISNEYLYCGGNPVINLSDPLCRDAFIELIKKTNSRWDVIIFDNLSSFLPGIKENDQEAWAPINGFFLQLKWMGKAVIFIHHAGKSGDQRGTSGREDQLDFVLKLTLPAGHDPADGCKFDATLTKSRSLTGAEAAPFTFEITEHENGGLTWAVTNQRESRKETIIALLGNGVSQKTISDLMGVDKAYISRTRTTAIKNKILTDSGASFTAIGSLKYSGVDIEKYIS